MNENIKPNFISRYHFSKKTLLLISLLFIITMAFAPLIFVVNGYLTVDATVENEIELRNAINAAPDGKGCTIAIWKNIALEKPLVIPEGKQITLGASDFCLVGANGMDTIIVKSGGELALCGSLVVTHADGDTGRGVYVERGGTFSLVNGVISGNSAVEGGGVYNEGVFNMWWEINAQDGVISGNSATKGGGVYNMGTFTLYGGHIRNNNCTDTSTSIAMGGGVYNEGTFNIINGYISDNIATKGGGVYNIGILEGDVVAVTGNNIATSGQGDDTFSEEVTDGLSYLLPIVGVVVAVVVVAVGLFFYRVRRRKPLMVNNGSALCFDWRATYEKT